MHFIRTIPMTSIFLRFSCAGVLFFAFLGCALSSHAQEKWVLDLEGSVVRCLKANPRMTAVRFEALGAGYGRKSALGSFGPSATAGYGYTRLDHKKPNRDAFTSDDDYYSANFNVHQSLFTGWNILSTYQKASLSEDYSRAKVENVELSLIQSAQENFLGLLKARENVRSATDSVVRLREHLKVTSAFYDVGLKPRLDVLQAEVDLAEAEDDLLKAQNAVDTQTVRLHTLLNLSLDENVTYTGGLEYRPFSIPFADCLAKAYENRPDLLMARKSVEIARKDLTITHSAFYPQIGADFDWASQGDDRYAAGSPLQRTEYSAWSVGVSAQWKFFEWGKTYFAGRQAKQKVAQLESEEAGARQEATFEVKSNHLKIKEAAARISVTRKALEEAREGYRMAVARYQAQVGTNTDVLDAQARVTRSEADLTEALADYQIALSKIFVSMGEKNPSLTTGL